MKTCTYRDCGRNSYAYSCIYHSRLIVQLLSTLRYFQIVWQRITELYRIHTSHTHFILVHSILRLVDIYNMDIALEVPNADSLVQCLASLSLPCLQSNNAYTIVVHSTWSSHTLHEFEAYIIHIAIYLLSHTRWKCRTVPLLSITQIVCYIFPWNI